MKVCLSMVSGNTITYVEDIVYVHTRCKETCSVNTRERERCDEGEINSLLTSWDFDQRHRPAPLATYIAG